jgi:hypothetical protein
LLGKFKESAVSVLPVVAIVFLLNLTPLVDFSFEEIFTFLISAVFLIVGISLFNLGADIAMTPMGENIGSGLTRLKKMSILLIVAFAMGILITVAEPDLTVLAEQVKSIGIEPLVLILTVGIGVGIFLVIGIIKIVTHKPISSLLMYSYMLLFMFTSLLIVVGGEALIPLAFDSGGVTTGPITVPFIMALGVGIASTIGGKNANENSFGLISLCSVGPMLAVLILGCTSDGGKASFSPDYAMDNSISNIFHVFLETCKEVIIALALIVAFFFILQYVCLKLPKTKIYQILIGLAYTFIGLVIFLSAVKIGFMPIGYRLGIMLSDRPVFVTIFAFIIGMVVVLAEPAVHVLNKQVEDITEGSVSRKSMMIALCIGVGLSIGLSVLRIVLDFNVLYYLIPGYLISLTLSFFVPGLYTAIAFDSGGVASGPLTSSFILPFAVGVCYSIQGADKILVDAFGIVAMVAMAPLITIQLLGFKSVLEANIQKRIAMARILAADDEQIIDFM